MKWYHFQEGGQVPFQTLDAANQRKAIVDERAGDLQSDIDATAWALRHQGENLGTRIDNLNTGFDKWSSGFDKQLGEHGTQLGGYGIQLDEFGNQIGGFDERFRVVDDQLARLQKQFGGLQNQAAIDQAIAVDQAERDALSRSCLLYTSPSPRDRQKSRMPSSA